MLYVEQSLNPNEEIIRVGQFHWFYTFNAALWIVFGFLGMFGILYAGYYFEISMAIRNEFDGLPENLYLQAWAETVQRRGGMMNVISGLHFGVKAAAFGALVFGILAFVNKMIVKATTEICITTDRLILKRGIIARHVDEISVDRIEGVNVIQGILGRLMDFGLVIVRGMGVGEVMLPPIEDPVGFRKSIERARSAE